MLITICKANNNFFKLESYSTQRLTFEIEPLFKIAAINVSFATTKTLQNTDGYF